MLVITIFNRGNWQSIDVPQASGMSVTEHYDIFPVGLPLTSRKSSSSTDSSSCLSIHSRSTTSSSERGSDSYSGGGVSYLERHKKSIPIFLYFARKPYVCILIYIPCGVEVSIFLLFVCPNRKNHRTTAILKILPLIRVINLYFQNLYKFY